MRTYIYKIVILNGENLEGVRMREETGAWVLRPFDKVKFASCLKMFEGRHCFSNFVKINNREPDPLGYYRTVSSCRLIEKAETELLYSGDSSLHETLYVEIKSKSFLWHQIRILVSTCLKYAKNEVSNADIEAMLTETKVDFLQSGEKWEKNKASPFGLYLTNIEYSPDIYA
jgi:tRNA pseudouridine(38-40) synthase